MKTIAAIIGLLVFWMLSSLEARPPSKGWARFRAANISTECMMCGRKTHLELHHVVPVSRGGLDTPRNVRTLCQWCHDVWGHLGNDADGYNLDLDEDAAAFRERVKNRDTGGRAPK